MTANQANTHTIMYDNKFLCGHEASLPFEIQLSDDGIPLSRELALKTLAVFSTFQFQPTQRKTRLQVTFFFMDIQEIPP